MFWETMDAVMLGMLMFATVVFIIFGIKITTESSWIVAVLTFVTIAVGIVVFLLGINAIVYLIRLLFV